MSATATKSKRPYIRVTEDEHLEAIELINKLKKRGWKTTVIASTLGFRSEQSIYNIMNLSNSLSREKLEHLRSLVEETEVATLAPAPEKSAAETPPAPVSRAQKLNALGYIQSAQDHLAKAHTALVSAHEVAIKLLKPGLESAITQIEATQRDIAI